MTYGNITGWTTARWYDNDFGNDNMLCETCKCLWFRLCDIWVEKNEIWYIDQTWKDKCKMIQLKWCGEECLKLHWKWQDNKCTRFQWKGCGPDNATRSSRYETSGGNCWWERWEIHSNKVTASLWMNWKVVKQGFHKDVDDCKVHINIETRCKDYTIVNGKTIQ